MNGIPRLCDCGQVVPFGVRCECQIAATRARNRRHDALRGSASSRGYDAEWRRESSRYLLQHALCVECARNGIRTEASVVDHVISIRRAPHLRLDRNNWQSLCTPCHSSWKQKQERSQ